METQQDNGILEEFRIEFVDCWRRLPNKGFFLGLLAVWLALFHFFGSATLGYVRTPSLFGWMYNAFSGGSAGFAHADESYGLLIPVVVLGLFWVKRRELMALEIRLWWPALFLLFSGLIIHVLGYAVQQSRISVVGLFIGIYGLMGLAWGPAWLRASFFPYFLFVFCVPLGSLADFITVPLRLLVSQLVEIDRLQLHPLHRRQARGQPALQPGSDCGVQLRSRRRLQRHPQPRRHRRLRRRYGVHLLPHVVEAPAGHGLSLSARRVGQPHPHAHDHYRLRIRRPACRRKCP